jgi:iron complex transport system ATP-binding protein
MRAFPGAAPEARAGTAARRPMLRVQGLAFGFASREVGAGVDFELRQGETLAVLGGNGAGKTTLLRTLLGLLPARAGRVEIDGTPLATLGVQERARRIAYVPQHHVPPFAFRVLDSVLMGRAARLPAFARPGAADLAAARAALSRLRVEFLAERPVTELSGGERQLVQIARALAQETPVLVLDEPTASLDFGHRARVLAELDRLRAGGLAIVFSTHEPQHALTHADRALLIAGGVPLACDSAIAALTAQNVTRLYGVDVDLVDVGGRKVFVAAEPRGPAAPGDGAARHAPAHRESPAGARG